MTDITDSALLFINPVTGIRPSPIGFTRIFCVMESDWVGSNWLTFWLFSLILNHILIKIW